MSLSWALAAGFLAAISAPPLIRVLGRGASRLLALVPLALTAYFAWHTPQVLRGEFVSVAHPWIEPLGVTLELRLDGLALLLALLIEGIGALIFLYAGEYLRNDARLGRFFAWFFVFKASMLGLVLAADVITLFIFWELTSISSFMLIGHHSEFGRARRAALQALLVTVGGGQALLLGLIFLASIGGGTSFDALAAEAGTIRDSPLYLPALLLVVAGAVTKSAQVPFHNWLPKAMNAPTPVSAFLHSATMVKGGVILLLRMHPVLGGTAEWTWLVGGFGLVTLIVAAWLGLAKTDLKKLLAYSTVAALGGLMLLVGIGTPEALHAALVFLIAHALYKGSLFLTAGIVDQGTGTRQISELSGLRRRMPIAAITGVVGALSMMGVAPAMGFVGKEALYEVATATHPALAATATLAFIALGAVALIVGVRPFFGALSGSAEKAKEARGALLLGPMLLALAGLGLGLIPGTVSLLADAALRAIGTTPPAIARRMWHGLEVPLILSLASLALGIGVFLFRASVRKFVQKLVLPRFGPQRLYELSLHWLDSVARAQTRIVQSGRLRIYSGTVLLSLGVLVVIPMARFTGSRGEAGLGGAQVHEVCALIVAAVGALTAVTTRSLMTAVVALGAVGLAESTLYLFFAAPDLALTQVVVQILMLVFIALLLNRKPEVFKTFGKASLAPILVAASAALAITALLLHVVSVPPHRELADTFAKLSQPEAHGRNIVNVILVDFRSFDTLGEIAILMVTGVGVLALMRFRSRGFRR